MFYDEIKEMIQEDEQIVNQIVFVYDYLGSGWSTLPAQIRVIVWENLQNEWEITLVAKDDFCKDVFDYKKAKEFFDEGHCQYFKYVGGGIKYILIRCLIFEEVDVIKELKEILRLLCNAYKRNLKNYWRVKNE